jgi:hypothetical protein
MPNTYGVISIYDRTRSNGFSGGSQTLLLKHKFYFSSGYQINPIMEYIHRNLGESGQMYSFKTILNENTGQSEEIPVRRTVFSRYLIVINLSGYHLKNNMQTSSAIIKRDLQEEHYIPFMTYLYKLLSESEKYYNGNMWEQFIGYAPVHEIP